MKWLDPTTDPIDLDTIYVVDVEGGRYRRPGDYDPTNLWAALVTRTSSGTLNVLLARPTMASLGAALGRAGLLSRRGILAQLRRLVWRNTAGADIDAEAPPEGADRCLMAWLA